MDKSKTWLAVFETNTYLLVTCGWVDNVTVQHRKIIVSYVGAVNTVTYTLDKNALLVYNWTDLVRQYQHTYKEHRDDPYTQVTIKDTDGDRTDVSANTARFFQRLGMVQSSFVPSVQPVFTCTSCKVSELLDLLNQAHGVE